MMRTPLVAVCLLVSVGCGLRHRGAATSAPDMNKIRVYVATLPRLGIPTEDQILREKTTSLVANYLKGRKTLALVDASRAADVQVQVLSAVSIFSPASDTRFDPNLVPVDVTAAGKTTRLTASRAGLNRTTHKVAQEIDRWIQDNRSAILAARGPSK